MVALISIAWTVGAVLTSGMPERHDPAVIALGMTLVAVSLAGYVVAVPRGPVGLIALCAAGEGLGFGMAWTFILRRAGRLVRDDDAERLAAALPTVSQIGYALGAAVVGILANSAGFGPDPTPETAVRVAHWVFAGSLPFALLALVTMLRFVTVRA